LLTVVRIFYEEELIEPRKTELKGGLRKNYLWQYDIVYVFFFA